MLIWCALTVLLLTVCWPLPRSAAQHQPRTPTQSTKQPKSHRSKRTPRAAEPPPEATFCDLLERVVTLVSAGIIGHRAWVLVLAESDLATHPDTACAQLATALEHTADVPEALAHYQDALPRPDPLISVTAISWRLAEQLGAPLASVLTSIVHAAQLANHAHAAREEALAGPQATLKLLAGLPIVGYFLAYALGANPFGVLFGTGFGWGLFIVGASFVAGTWWGVRWLTQTAKRCSTSPLDPQALLPDLVSAALHSGAAADHTLATLSRALDPWPTWSKIQAALTQVNQHRNWGATWTELPSHLPLPPSVAECCRAFALAERTGAPAAQLLAAGAQRRRRDESHRAQVAANQLSVRLVIPLGLGGLPAFFALVLIPTVVDLVSRTLAG